MISKQIEGAVSQLQSDFVFTYRELGFPAEMTPTVIRNLNRMVEKGIITKLSKGRYYKPRKTIFGQLKPSPEEIVKDLLTKDGKAIGYLTGYSVFNQLGLTTQISNIIEIGTNIRRNKKRRGSYEIRFILQPNPIKPVDIPLLQWLDALKYIKSIPDSDVNITFQRLSHLVKGLSGKSCERFKVLALAYTPMTRALAGVILDGIFGADYTQSLYDSLNPVTYYKVGIKSDNPLFKKWRIT